jgi:hypothetical protein
MSDAVKIAQHVPKALAGLMDTDLSLIEQAAVFRLAAESCTQAQMLIELSSTINRMRGPKA